MERAEDLAMSGMETVERPALLESFNLSRWALAFVSLQIVAIASLFSLGYTMNRRVEELKVNGLGQAQQSQSWSKQTEELGAETVALKKEVQELRQYLFSTASEEVIFLKTILLKTDIDPELARTIAKHVHHYSKLYGKDPNLVLAIIEVESNFDPKAVSSVGAQGLMQVMPQWKKVLGISGDLSSPEVSINYGLQILGFYTEMYKDLQMALTAYNRGPGPVDSALMRGVDPRNSYAPKVLEVHERLKRMSVQTRSL